MRRPDGLGVPPDRCTFEGATYLMGEISLGKTYRGLSKPLPAMFLSIRHSLSTAPPARKRSVFMKEKRAIMRKTEMIVLSSLCRCCFFCWRLCFVCRRLVCGVEGGSVEHRAKRKHITKLPIGGCDYIVCSLFPYWKTENMFSGFSSVLKPMVIGNWLYINREVG